MEFENCVVIVTGAARGQGAGHARHFVGEGAFVAFADVEDCSPVTDGLGDRAVPYSLDVTSSEGWAAMVDSVLARWGRIDVLVNNAGMLGVEPGRFLSPSGTPSAEADRAASTANFRRVLDVNVTGMFLGIQHVARPMADSGGGSIVNVSSIMGLRGSPRRPAYATSKWAVRGMTRSAAVELAPFDIRVNALLPGIIDTDMVRSTGQSESDILASHDSRLLIKRLGSTVDMTQAVAFLASDRSSYLTGTDLLVDGGWTAH